MEKKTLGSLLAALRKANGMTQRELAERLNVSDKTVSRWERDDGAPDLGTLPVLAEIFGVTCDELLRGERRSPEERQTTAPPSEKGEKQRQRLLKLALSRYQNGTYLAVGLALLGLLAALIANLAFNSAVLGCLLGCGFFTAGAVALLIAVNKAKLAVEDAELDEGSRSTYLYQVFRRAERSLALTATWLGFVAPLMLVDAYMGLSSDSLLLFGSGGALLFLGLYGVGLHFHHARQLRAESYPLPAGQEEKFRQNHCLAGRCGTGLAAALIATLLFHMVGTELLWSTSVLAQGTVFQDYESFVAYMEEDIPYSSVSPGTAVEVVAPPTDKPVRDQEQSDEESLPRASLTALNGETVCTYLPRNRSVTSIRYSPKEDTVLPITVFTQTDMAIARQRSQLISTLFCLLYPLELLTVAAVYGKKRVR